MVVVPQDRATEPVPAAGEGVVTCDRCGRTEDDPATLLGWSSATERGRVRRYCGRCSRTHLRAMEAKLDPEHW